MSVGSMLSDLLSQASESKNYVIRETGIDRSTFYQILRGNRIATEDQIERICEYIHPDAATYGKLIDCYEEERVDAKTYQNRQHVKQFFNSLSEEETTGRHTREGQQIAAFLERETAAGAERFRLFLPSISRRTTDVFQAMENSAPDNEKAPEILQLLAEEGSRRGAAGRYPKFKDWFFHLKGKTIRFHAYSLGKSMTGLNTVAFPYYIIGGTGMLLISYNEKQIVEVQDPGIVNAYRDNFDHILKDGEEIASTETDYISIMQFFYRNWMTIGREPVYLLTPRPCAWLCSTDEMVRKYMQEEEFVSYGQTFRNLNVREFTTQNGMEAFFMDSRIHEAGVDLRIDPEDMKKVRETINEHRDRITFLLDDRRVRVHKEWQMFLIGRQAAVFVPYERTNYMICFTSRDMVDPLADWFESRVTSLNNDIIRKKGA